MPRRNCSSMGGIRTHSAFGMCFQIISPARGISTSKTQNGYDLNTMNWNAGEGCRPEIGDFDSSTRYCTFEEGYDELAHGTAQMFCDAGGEIWTNNGLVTFSRLLKKSFLP